MTATLAALGGYVLVQLGVGAYVSRRVATESDYLLAGRRLGPALTTATLFATWFGAETLVGSSGAIYTDGLSGGTADPFGYGLCLLVFGALFAAPLWRRGLTTLADLFAQRFGARVERLAVLVMAPPSVLWAAAQVRAFGQILAGTVGLDVDIAITAAALVVVAYTVFGGMLADAYTDLIQGSVLIIGLVVLAAVLLGQGAGEALAAVEPARLALVPAGTGFWAVVEAWAIPVCGSVVAAELAQRALSSRSAGTARASGVSAAGLYLVVGLIPLGVGLIGPSLAPGLDEPEQLLTVVAREAMPPVLFVVFIGALLSAILSTVDSALLTAAGLVSHNVVVRLRPGMSEAGRVRTARACVVGFGALAWGLAVTAEGVLDLVQEASAFASAGVFVCVAMALFTRVGGARAAAAALVAGAAAWVVGAYVVDLPLPYLGSLAAAALGYAGGTQWERPAPRHVAEPPGSAFR